ncbi:MAG: hypothetical protein ACRDP1_14490 [Nocardioidaceae bacterium]
MATHRTPTARARGRNRQRRGWIPVIAVAALLAGCSQAQSHSQPILPSPTGPDSVPAGLSCHAPDVSATEATRGWFLAVVTTGHPAISGGPSTLTSTSLALVDPSGGRHTVCTLRGRQSVMLLDWSPAGQRALLEIAGRTKTVTVLDLRTGSGRTLHLPSWTDQVGFEGPRGRAVLYGTAPHRTHGTSHSGALQRLDLRTGHTTTLETSEPGAWLTGPSGEQVVTSAQEYGTRRHQDMRVVTDDGDLVRAIPSTAGCTPVRWWNRRTILATCAGYSLLWLFASDGSHATPLTTSRANGPDLGDTDARRVSSGLFTQSLGPCGVVFVAMRDAHGRAYRVDVPHTIGNIMLLGATRHRLVLQVTSSCDGGPNRSELVRFNPVTKNEQVISQLPARMGYQGVLPYGEVRAARLY